MWVIAVEVLLVPVQAIGAMKFDSLSPVANVEDSAVLCVAAELGPLGIVGGWASVSLSSFCYLEVAEERARREWRG